MRRGDTLSRIASRQGVSESTLVAANNLRSRNRIHPGQVLVLPETGPAVAWREPIAPATPEPSLASLGAEPEVPPADGLYAVHVGDTLWSIARRFGTTERELVRANDLDSRHRIQAGQSLRIPGGEQVVASASEPPIAAETPAAPTRIAAALPTPPEPVAPPSAEYVPAAAPSANDAAIPSASPPAVQPEAQPAAEPRAETVVTLARDPEPPPLLAAARARGRGGGRGQRARAAGGREVESAEDETLPEVTAALASEPTAPRCPRPLGSLGLRGARGPAHHGAGGRDARPLRRVARGQRGHAARAQRHARKARRW